MSYVITRPRPKPRPMVKRRSRARRGRQKGSYTALAGLLDDILDVFSPAASLADAIKPGCGVDATPITTLYAQIAQVGTSWNPTGLYTPDDVQNIVALCAQMRSAADNGLNVGENGYDTPILKDTRNEVISVGQRGMAYFNAASDARASGQNVSAPDLKQWVIDSMRVSLDAMVAAASATCDQPGWFTALAGFQSAFNQVWTGVTAVAGVVAKVGEKVVNVVSGGLDLIATIEKIAPFAAVGLAAWWIFLREKKRA